MYSDTTVHWCCYLTRSPDQIKGCQIWLYPATGHTSVWDSDLLHQMWFIGQHSWHSLTSLSTFDLHCSHTYMYNLVLWLQHIDIALCYTLTPRLISALDNDTKMQRAVGTKSCNSCTSVILRISCSNLGTGYVLVLRSHTLLVFSTFSYSRCYIHTYNCSEIPQSINLTYTHPSTLMTYTSLNPTGSLSAFLNSW